MKKILRWLFKNELETLQKEIDELSKLKTEMQRELIPAREAIETVAEMTDSFKHTMSFYEMDASVDVEPYSRSWAVISIQGERQDFIKFIDLGQRDIQEIASFLRHYDRTKVDAAPNITGFLKSKRNRF